jgi:hypothetical protein
MADEVYTQAVLGAALALADRVRPSKHSQLCPVWARRQPIATCDCWILKQARRDTAIVAPFLTSDGRRHVIEALRDDDLWQQHWRGEDIAESWQYARQRLADYLELVTAGEVSKDVVPAPATRVDPPDPPPAHADG